MNKEFDFDDIGKKTPYRTPDNFFEDNSEYSIGGTST